MRRFAVFLALATAGCGLHPLYQGGAAGPAAAGLADIAVTPMEGKAGWLMANALNDRLGNNGGGGRYRLDVKLDDRITGLGLRRDASVTRERRSLRARYQLVDTASGATMIDTTAGSDAGLDVVTSEYATIAAENTALENLTNVVADQIVARLAVRIRQTER